MKKKICVVGLGYVGLPLAVEFSLAGIEVIGFDVNEKKISELKNNIDSMGEVSSDRLKNSSIKYTTDQTEISQADYIIVTVPTPVSKDNAPDTSYVHGATKTVGKNMKKGAIVVYESTVYPGLTEEECVPLLEETSGMKYMKDFFVGYSPERINPGDKLHTVDKIMKVVSGCDEKTGRELVKLYKKIIKVGVHLAPTIKTAEAAKVIENIQRDLNIALMNELSVIFNKMNIDTHAVLEAAGTKWNFHKYVPGLVGGHCIGVDPYYLTFKAKSLGVQPKIILAGRELNDSMHEHIIRLINNEFDKDSIKDKDVLVLGLTFKENIKDIRNSRTKELIDDLIETGSNILVCDPMLSDDDMKAFHKDIVHLDELCKSDKKFDVIILTVPHNQFLKLGTKKFEKLLKGKKIIFDIRRIIDKKDAIKAGIKYLSF